MLNKKSWYFSNCCFKKGFVYVCRICCYPIKSQQKHHTAKCLWFLVFSASRETLILPIRDLQNSILLKNSRTLFIHHKCFLLCVETHDIFYLEIQWNYKLRICSKRLLFGLDSKMVIKYNWTLKWISYKII